MQAPMAFKTALQVIDQLSSPCSNSDVIANVRHLIASFDTHTGGFEGYSVFLSQLMNKLLANSATCPESHDLLLFATREARADVWLEVLILNLQAGVDAGITILILSLISKYLLDFNRLPHFFSHLIDRLSAVPEKTRFTHTVELTRQLINLPTLVTNALKSANDSHKIFTPDVFYPFLLRSIAPINNSLLKSVVISQSCLLGFGSHVWKFLLAQLTRSPGEVDGWASALAATPEKALEPTVVPLLKQAVHPHLVHLCLHSSLATSPNALFRLFRRLLLLRSFSSPRVPLNIFGCLAESPELYGKTENELGIRLLNVWSSATSLQRTSSRQRVYINQALAIWVCASAQGIKESPSYADIRTHVLQGITAHLACNVEEQRVLGMAVGEWLVKQINLMEPSEGQTHELKFTYQENEAVRKVKPLFEPIPPYESPTDSGKLSSFPQKSLWTGYQFIRLVMINDSLRYLTIGQTVRM